MTTFRPGPIGAVLFTAVTAVAGCDPPDVTIAGHEFHLSRAVVVFGEEGSQWEGLYSFEIRNMEDPCQWPIDMLPPRLDDLWLLIHHRGALTLEGPPHPLLGRVEVAIGGDPAEFETLVYGTSGGEIVEITEGRLHLEIALTHAGETPFEGPWTLLDEPVAVELDLPYTTCD